jgi:FdhD protein
MRVCEDDALADVKLNQPDFVLPQKRILTSGCGGGVGLNMSKVASRIETDISVAPKQILRLMRYVQESAKLYNLTGGLHTSALCDDKPLAVAKISAGTILMNHGRVPSAKYPPRTKSC